MELSAVSYQQSVKSLFLMFFAESRKLMELMNFSVRLSPCALRRLTYVAVSLSNGRCAFSDSLLESGCDFLPYPFRRIRGIFCVPDGPAYDNIIGTVSDGISGRHYPFLIVLIHNRPGGPYPRGHGNKFGSKFSFYRGHLKP
jgi:hypothetical protein